MPQPNPAAHPPAAPSPRSTDRSAAGWRAPGRPPEQVAGTPEVERLRFTTCDKDEGIDVLERVYAIRRIQVAPDGPFTMTQGACSVEGMSLERAQLAGAPMGALVDATGVVRVGQVLAGRLDFTDRTRATPGPVPFLFPVRPYACRWNDLDLLTVSLDLAAVQAHAAGLLGVDELGLRFTGAEPVSPAMARYLAGVVRAAGRDQLGNEAAMANRLLRAEAFRSLATAVLHAFPGTFLDRQAQAVEERPSPAGVRRAVAYMEEHLGEDIGLAEIAAAARMSPRGLQAAFRREVGATPMAHLRALRLEAVHADLLAAGPGAGAGVADIASRWGFVHPGRFAAAYRTRYGQNPAATLRA
ncbi:helix-turn-helix transcriptional regulator [Kocuria rosea]|uniref:helix-turn-helix transcriptional regulator n=1 Tax=Kocuria rosea TaxID=1275 RepID=UPI00203FC5C9|nr:helix-turn-helix transcriptional regulator [Kocuria rosea]MCM3688630.1 helix-turn-helix transcriptional regulator [Kocuria rosea]